MKVQIQFTYRTRKGIQTTFYSEEMAPEQALMIAEDIEKTGRSKGVIFLDQQGVTWNMKEIKKYLKEVETEAHNITIYFDGGYERHMKKSGLGCVIYYEKNNKQFRIRKNALVEGLTSNNEAEYAALHLALQELEILDVHHLTINIIGDSQVVIKQLSEDWPTYEEELLKWADRIDNKLEQMGLTPVYEVVSRKENKEADQLASQALSGVEIFSTSEILKE